MPFRRIYADISELQVEAPIVILDSDASAGASTITVKSILGVSTSDILLFRGIGNEQAEIIATHAATSPSGNTITLVTTLVESHPAGTSVYVIPANQVRFYRSATEVNANSDDSTLTALASATNIDPTTIKNFYDDSTYTSGYYYYRFSDSINSVNLYYSDAIPVGTFQPEFAQDEIGYIFEEVQNDLSISWSDKFSKRRAIGAVNACLRFIEGRLKKWSKYQSFDYVLGQTSRGSFTYTLPTEMYDRNSNKSLLSARIQTALQPLIYLDEKEFDQQMRDVIYTTVRTQATSGATSLNVANSYSFTDSGTVTIFTDNTADNITYTGITRSATAGVFTGVPASGSGSIEATHAVSTNVWQNHIEGEPRYLNIRDGQLRIWPLPSSDWKNRNVLIDFYTSATSVDSESDSLDATRYDMVKHWLRWEAKNILRNSGKPDLTDSDYQLFLTILNEAVRREISGQRHKMTPKINQIKYRPTSRDDIFDRSS